MCMHVCEGKCIRVPVPEGQEEGIHTPGTGVAGGFQLPNMWGNESMSLEESYVY